MSILDDITLENLKNKGIEGFGFTMPSISHKWCDEASTTITGLTYNESNLSLSLSGSNWLTPFTGLLQVVNTSDRKIQITLQKVDGSMVNENGILIRLFPQQVLRLKRLSRNLFEDINTHNKKFANGMPLRQVPAYLFVATEDDITSIEGGIIQAKEDIGCSGELSFFDEQGYIIHPLYIASVCKTILAQQPILNIDSALENQLDDIIDKEASETTTVRFVKADGTAFDGNHIEGITAIDDSIGLFSVDAYTGTDATLKGEIKRAESTDDDGDFPALEAFQQVMGLITYSRMGEIVNIPKLKDLDSDTTTNSLKHDFFTVKVIQLKEYLIGNANEDYNGTKFEPKPSIRINEQLRFLNSGNAVMGRLSTIFEGAATKQLLSAISIDNKLNLPLNETDILWPNFPALPVGIIADDANYPTDFKAQLQTHGTATFIDSVTPPARDVILTLQGLPLGCAVRVYNRVFLDGANIERGDGAGGLAHTELASLSGRTFNGEAKIILKDPLGIMRPDGTFVVAGNPTLICDIMIIPRNTNRKRLFGALSFAVGSPVAAPIVGADNLLAPIANQGICPAGILGLDAGVSPSIDLTTLSNMLNTILAFGDDTQPRNAHRLPTMMRRDLLASSLKTGSWSSLLSAGSVSRDMHNANQELGCPGSLGGKENDSFGIYTEQGRLSYDIARMAFRRTTNFYDRIEELKEDNWNEPSANTALGETETATDAIGTFAGSLLQNISPFCETPELALLKSIVESEIDSIPATFDDLVDWAVDKINDMSTGSLSGLLLTGVNRLKSELVDKLNELKDDTTLNESKKERLFNELKREISSSCFGRRDTQWAIEQAFKQARNFIYIETPGLSFTEGDSENYSLDLWNILQTQLDEKPGLKVIICVPKKPGYQKQYDQWIRSEVKERYTLVQSLSAKQVVCFHPIGFPGRDNFVQNNIIIVDDQWALIGSSSMHRRGLSFDGSADMVFTDLDTIHGHANSIKQFRKLILSQRIGVSGNATIDSKAVMIDNPALSFKLIREMLVAGGLGKIEPLWNGRTEGIVFSEPSIDRLLANPEGNEFNSLSAAINLILAGLMK
ncbi:MAG TPA: hypothetical protein PLU17_02565 [Chitinophagaceae bacterium]|nr:hypothetical protein [Chitinophagaceae bacterium]